MGDILFLAHRIPFPPDRGDKIRSNNLLHHLAGLSRVHFGCFAETEADRRAEDELATIAESYCLADRTKPLPLAGMQALAGGKPVSLTAFNHTELRRWVTKTLAEYPVDTIFVFSGQMGQYVPDDFEGRVVIDLCDVDSAKFEQYGATGAFPRSWIDRREGRLLAQEEARLARRASTTLLVSEAEAELFKSRIGSREGVDIRAVRNGIDTEKFAPSAADPHPDLTAISGPHLVFTGQMDYAPNVEAAKFVADAILPRVRQQFPQAQFHIVGRAPVRDISALDGKDGVRVWGEVPDVRPFIAGADIVVAPLKLARGIQNKVLEAMAMARPIVLSKGAATGIDAKDGEHFRIADGGEQSAEAICALLADGPAALAMGAAARRFVCENQSWPAMLEPLGEIAGFAGAESGNRKASRDAA